MRQECHTVRRLVPVLIAGLLAVAGLVAPSPRTSGAAASSNPKVVLIVGATESTTASYRADMDSVYATATQYTSNVIKVYSPNATWAAVKAAMQGASIVVYMSHGNGVRSRTSPRWGPIARTGSGSTRWPARVTATTTTTARATSRAR